MKTNTLDWNTSLARWQAINARANQLATQYRARRQKLAHELLMRAGVGDPLCAYNWGCALDGWRGMLCQRALTLLADWRAADWADRIGAMAWNRYMTPHGTPVSRVKEYRADYLPVWCQAA
jgi:hypothetical protein